MQEANSMTQSKAIKQESILRDYYELGKPRITMFVCMTAMASFYLASTNGVAVDRLIFATIGIYMVSFGSCVFNQIIEIRIDQRMHRTQNRALPTYRVPLLHAWLLGMITTLLGLLMMFFQVNTAATLWLLAAWCGYVLIYTPLKVKTTLNTLVGSVVGALPPIVGWVSARGRLGFEGVILFLILFFWQLPHFLAISWMYRDDYARAKVKMITSVDPAGILTPRQAFLYTVLLFPVVMLPFVFSMAGYIYLIGTLFLTALFTKAVVEFWKITDQKNAKLVLLTSIIYLPAVFILLVVDKVG
ncbi:MAG: heme o synthase [Bdellovibrionota bacterium]|nr:heme o synthase [Deltaproteobacteria bacterium]